MKTSAEAAKELASALHYPEQGLNGKIGIIAAFLDAREAELRGELEESRHALQDKSEWAKKMRESYESELATLKDFIKKYCAPRAQEYAMRLEADNAALKAQVERMKGVVEAAKKVKSHVGPNHRCSLECSVLLTMFDALTALSLPPAKHGKESNQDMVKNNQEPCDGPYCPTFPHSHEVDCPPATLRAPEVKTEEKPCLVCGKSLTDGAHSGGDDDMWHSFVGPVACCGSCEDCNPPAPPSPDEKPEQDEL